MPQSQIRVPDKFLGSRPINTAAALIPIKRYFAITPSRRLNVTITSPESLGSMEIMFAVLICPFSEQLVRILKTR
jgi:hypothetical protein